MQNNLPVFCCFFLAVTTNIEIVCEDPAPPRHDAVLEDDGHELLEALGLIDEALSGAEEDVGASVGAVEGKVRKLVFCDVSLPK